MQKTKGKVITQEKTICAFPYNMLADEPDVLTVQDIMRILRIGRNKAYELIQDGKIRSISVGGKFIIPKIRVIEFLEMAS